MSSDETVTHAEEIDTHAEVDSRGTCTNFEGGSGGTDTQSDVVWRGTSAGFETDAKLETVSCSIDVMTSLVSFDFCSSTIERKQMHSNLFNYGHDLIGGLFNRRQLICIISHQAYASLRIR